MMLSVIVPVYNEAKALPHLLAALKSMLARLACDHEILFIDDGSKDQSLYLLELAAAADSQVKVFSLSRNFGHQAAITAGLDFAAGDAVVVMDADLQDPPEVLLKMMDLYEQGYDIVSAQRIQREGDATASRPTVARGGDRAHRAAVAHCGPGRFGDGRGAGPMAARSRHATARVVSRDSRKRGRGGGDGVDRCAAGRVVSRQACLERRRAGR